MSIRRKPSEFYLNITEPGEQPLQRHCIEKSQYHSIPFPSFTESHWTTLPLTVLNDAYLPGDFTLLKGVAATKGMRRLPVRTRDVGSEGLGLGDREALS